jgi:simple sugar transport system permease protein
MLLSLLFAIIAIVVSILLLTFIGFEINMAELIKYAVTDVIGNNRDLAQVFYYTTPLIFTGLSVAIAFRAGLFNIGAQGQMMMGAVWAGIFASAIVPNYLSFMQYPILIIPLTMIVGMIFGGIWGFVPGYLKAKTGAHEVIVTILMNLIAITFTNFLVGSQTYSPFIDKTSLNAYGQTDVIVGSAKINPLFPQVSNFLDWSIFVAIIVAIIIHTMLFKSNFGFKIRAVGLNPTAAKTAGIDSDRIVISSMVLAGAMAGLAGALLVQGGIRYVLGIESSYGFDGIAVALIGANNPLGVMLAALFFGFLFQSRLNLDANTDIPPDLILALQAWIVLFAAAPMIARKLYMRLLRLRAEKEENDK